MANENPFINANGPSSQVVVVPRPTSTAGAGTGDVTGPSGAVAGNFSVLDATGKVISDSGVAPEDFALVGESITPTQLATELTAYSTTEEVMDLLGGTKFNFFMDNLASDLSIADYYTLGNHETGAAETTISKASLNNGDLIAAYATLDGFPNFPLLRAGSLDLHFTAAKTAGTKTLAIQAKLYERADATPNDETLIVTFAATGALTSKAFQDVYGTLTEDYILTSGSRLVLKFFAVVSGSGTAPTAAIYQEGDLDSQLEVSTTIESLDARFEAKLSGPIPLVIPTGLVVPSAYSGAWALNTVSARSDGYNGIVNTSDTNGDYISYDFYIPSGTYTVEIQHLVGSAQGIMDILLDGTKLGASRDCYDSGANAWDVTMRTSVEITTGAHTIKLLVNGKNASASNYYLNACNIAFRGVLS